MGVSGMVTTIISENLTCPYCKKQVEAATGAIDPKAIPKPEDVSICFYCGEIMIFAQLPGNDHMVYRKPSPEELVEILRDCPALNAVQKRILTRGR